MVLESLNDDLQSSLYLRKQQILTKKKNIIDFYTGIHKSFLLLISLENIINFVLSIYILELNTLIFFINDDLQSSN